MKPNYNIEFNINKAPPSDADIKATLAWLEKPSTLFKRLTGLIAAVVITSIGLIYIVFPLMALAALTPLDMDFSISEWITGQRALTLSSALTILIVFSVLAFNGLGIQADIQKLSAVDSTACAHIINLCTQYPQIAAYRLAVTKERHVVNADYEAMKDFARKQYLLDFTAKQQANIDAVQNQAPITIDNQSHQACVIFDETTGSTKTPEELDRFYSDLRKVAGNHGLKLSSWGSRESIRKFLNLTNEEKDQ